MKAIKVNILVGTPCYNSMLHSDYVHSVISFHERKLPFAVLTLGSESLITRARNTIISHFYRMENFTHLLFLDSDIHLHADGLVRLLAQEVDVIGAPVALKGYDAETGKPVYNTGKLIEDKGNGLIMTDRVGTAVFLLSRKAADALVRHAVDNGNTYMGNPNTRGDSIDDMKMYDIFQVGVKGGEYLSEDYWACKILRKLGFDIYVDTNVQTRHNGMYVFN